MRPPYVALWCCSLVVLLWSAPTLAGSIAPSIGRTTFNFPSFSPAAAPFLSLIGNASLCHGLGCPEVLTLAQTDTELGGAAWFRTTLWADAFSTSFAFRAVGTGAGGDGVALVLQNGAPRALSPDAGGIGYGNGLGNTQGGIAASLAVEFDTFVDAELGDPNAPHISVHTRGLQRNDAHESASIGMVQVAALRNEQHEASVRYAEGKLEVSLDGKVQLEVEVDLLNVIGASSSTEGIWIGITSNGRRDGGDLHQLLKWSYGYEASLAVAKTLVYGPGWEDPEQPVGKLEVGAGSRQEFFIQALDNFGHPYYPREEGGDPNFSGKLGAEVLPATLIDDGGVYAVAYNETRAGTYSLQVLHGDAPLGRLPSVAVSVLPGDLDLANTLFSGDTGGGTIDTQLELILTTRDVWGNAVQDEALEFRAVFDPADVQVKTTRGPGVGEYVVTYSSNQVGTYSLSLFVNGGLLPGSPFDIFFSEGNIEPSSCTAKGDGIAGGIAGSLIEFKVQMRDKNGNKAQRAPESLVVTVTSHNNQTASITPSVTPDPQVKGVYHVSYTTKKAGAYTLSVKVNGVNIAHSPWSFVFVRPGLKADPKLSRVRGVGLRAARAGEGAEFVIEGVDEFGNRMASDTAKWHVHITDLQMKMNNASVARYTAPGEWSVRYMLTRADWGYFVFVALVGDNNVETELPGSPFMLTVSAGPASALDSSGEGAGLASVQQRGTEASFTLIARDVFNNPIATTFPFLVRIENANDKTQLVPSNGEPGDARLGEWIVKYTPTSSGEYWIRVSPSEGEDEGTPIEGFPVFITVPPALSNGVIAAIVVSIVVGVSAVVVVAYVVWMRKRQKQAYRIIDYEDYVTEEEEVHVETSE